MGVRGDNKLLSLTASFRGRQLFFLGSGPDRRKSPVEWGEILYVRPSIRPYVRPPCGLLAYPQALLAGSQDPLAGPLAPFAGPQPL